MSQVVTKLTGVPRTLLLPLRGRADEQANSYPLFQDPWAVEWLKLVGWDQELEKYYTEAGKLSIVVAAVRTYQHDQIASRHIANHSHPVVVELGAGLSSRFHRIGQNADHWFELDLPVVTELRSKLDTQTEQHQFISASVRDFDWMNNLPNVEPENILFIAEGLLAYFEENEVQQLISTMRSRFPGATLDVEVLGNYAKNKISKNLSQLGAPLKWFVKNEEDLAAMGLQVVNTWPLSQIHQERWPWQWQLLFKFLGQFPYFRNGYLIVETKL
ncbi:MAG: class I SAM-dependent methyltransferase [Moorea sp. SIOASIH]|uniref:VatO n=1 Tax=Moorena producens ASI16Jul14-2 TaxID=2546228 RepID=A0A4P8JBR1_9CYAN|nr:class I SAM-dependent methyltransferase [Moorena sp. SIOASIH]NEO38507.1 class I SAM-dependent methyltransferase [Moorena sp. SIOASIH]QCP68986.1 VatO [Moorena producens ASI16Jul14-2]